MNDLEREHRQIQRYKEAYPFGTRLLLLNMKDQMYPVQSGIRGTDHGWCLTANTSESHNNAEGCTLSDILIHNVPDGYFLSKAAMRKISSNLYRYRKDGEFTI